MTEGPPTGPRRPRPGRQALFTSSRDPASPAPTAEGKRALFSAPVPSAGVPEPDRTTAVVHCRTCLAATRVSIGSLGLSLLTSVWMPTRRYPRLIRCPACHHRAWCRIDWPKLL